MVKAWREMVTIPTYEVGKPEKNPMFLEKRVYQGSSGVVYPYPVIETMSDEKVDKEYKVAWLENEYIKVMILPELGGRVQMAYDKIRERHFVYYNHVIKPALVGLAKNYDEVALDYCAAGLGREDKAIWDIAIEEGATTPMTYYYLNRYQEAEVATPDYCFPNRAEDVTALEAAKRENLKGARAPYYLGCLYYAARQYDLAIENWERSAQLDPQFPTVWRNIALTRFNKQDREQEALQYMERAFHLDENDERALMELDQLYKRMQKSHEDRLAFLQQYPQLVERRDDLMLEEIALLKLGRKGEADGRFYKLVNYGKQHIFDHVVMDYFAVSLPDLLIWEDSLDRKNLIHCKYMLALGYYGLGERDKALRYLAEVRQLDINHQGIQSFQSFIPQ